MLDLVLLEQKEECGCKVGFSVDYEHNRSADNFGKFGISMMRFWTMEKETDFEPNCTAKHAEGEDAEEVALNLVNLTPEELGRTIELLTELYKDQQEGKLDED